MQKKWKDHGVSHARGGGGDGTMWIMWSRKRDHKGPCQGGARGASTTRDRAEEGQQKITRMMLRGQQGITEGRGTTKVCSEKQEEEEAA